VRRGTLDFSFSKMDMRLLAHALTHAEKGGTTFCFKFWYVKKQGRRIFLLYVTSLFKDSPPSLQICKKCVRALFGQLFMYRVASPPNSTSSSLVAPEGLVRARWVSLRSQIHTKLPSTANDKTKRNKHTTTQNKAKQKQMNV
jgi:hypothetical protein